MPGGLIAIILFREVPITIYRIDSCKTMDVGDRSTSVSCDRSDYLLRNWESRSESQLFLTLRNLRKHLTNDCNQALDQAF